MGAEFTRVEDGAKAEDMWRSMATLLEDGGQVWLDDADSGKRARSIRTRDSQGNLTFKAEVFAPGAVYDETADKMSDPPIAIKEDDNPSVIIDFVLNEYAK